MPAIVYSVVIVVGCTNAEDLLSRHDEIAVQCTSGDWRRVWTTRADFKSPESAVIAKDHSSIFVSNVNGYHRNGAGFISRLASNGDVLDLEWLVGLNAPTGLSVHGDTLWAVDYDRIVEINIPTREIVRTYAAPDKNSLLNDVAVTDAGGVFVTGSATQTIYHLQDGKLIRWTADDDLLKDANGIAAGSETIYVAGYYLVAVGTSDRRIEKVDTSTALIDLEGVKIGDNGDLFVSAIGDRPMVLLPTDGVVKPILSGDSYVADFDWDGRLITAPIGPNTIAGFMTDICP